MARSVVTRSTPARRSRRRVAVLAAGVLGGGLCVALSAASVPAAAASTAPAASGSLRSAALAPGLLRRVRPGTAPALGGGRANSQSSNWSGYIKSGSGLTRSTASWHVPRLTTQHDGYSSSWVGIDGATSTDGYLIQTGTEQDVINGQARYYAWWEVITPTNEAPETRYSGFVIKPGDAMTAGVRKNGNGTWTMTLTDRTTGVTRMHTSAFAGPGRSAEWIQEDTDVNGFISPAPDWHRVVFTGITVNGANPKLTGAEAVDIYDGVGTQEDHTGAPNASRNGFGVTWLATGTPTPAP